MVRLGSKDSANKIQVASKSLLFKGPLYDVLSSRLLSWYLAHADSNFQTIIIVYTREGWMPLTKPDLFDYDNDDYNALLRRAGDT